MCNIHILLNNVSVNVFLFYSWEDDGCTRRGTRRGIRRGRRGLRRGTRKRKEKRSEKGNKEKNLEDYETKGMSVVYTMTMQSFL